jgi:hypothetical protein
VLEAAIRAAEPKPPDDAGRAAKKNYAETLSNHIAVALAGRLREVGCRDCQPNPPHGRERQFAGGIGNKKVDVSHASVEDGLILGVSVKTISFPDGRTRNFQKNLTNRRGDLLAEGTTLHQRFPYAVLGGLLILDERAEEDGTERRFSTFQTAHEYLHAFDRRDDRANAVEKFEALGIVLYHQAEPVSYRYYDIGDAMTVRPLDAFIQRLLERVVERNADRYRLVDGRLERRKRGGQPLASEEE